jgi:hypothetical protein
MKPRIVTRDAVTLKATSTRDRTRVVPVARNVRDCAPLARWQLSRASRLPLEPALRHRKIACALGFLAVALGAAPCRVPAQALPFLPAGDSRLRHEVELEADAGRMPLTMAWPLPTRDIPPDDRDAVRSQDQPISAQDAGWYANGAVKPTRLRVFENTPRENGELGVQGGWAAGDYAGGALRLGVAIKPQDDMHYRLDGSYAAWRFGNWWASAGMQSRWWGPGWDGSLILSNNARPMPGVALDRASAHAPEWRGLRWIGPWRVSTFMNRFEDRRPDHGKALLWGMRIDFQPLWGLQLGLTRIAQWCGSGRPCGLGTFWDAIIAKRNAQINNSGPNANLNAKPAANRVAIDLRWHPGTLPLAIYWQEDGETFDSGNYRPRQLLQLLGVEFSSRQWLNGRPRVFVEFADTACGAFNFGSSGNAAFGCAYEKDTYPAGYRFRGRALGDAMDRDGRRFTLGSLYVDASDRTWQLRLRRIDLNRGGIAEAGLTPQSVSTVRERLLNVESELQGNWHGLRYGIGTGLDRTRRLGARGWTGRGFVSLGSSW